MTIVEAEAHRLFPELARLALLPKLGWRFQPVAEDGDLVCLVGWRDLAEATDALWIYDRTDCLAARLVGDVGGASGVSCGGTPVHWSPVWRSCSRYRNRASTRRRAW